MYIRLEECLSAQYITTASDSCFLTATQITAEQKLHLLPYTSENTNAHSYTFTNSHKTGTVSHIESREMSVGDATSVTNSSQCYYCPSHFLSFSVRDRVSCGREITVYSQSELKTVHSYSPCG